MFKTSLPKAVDQLVEKNPGEGALPMVSARNAHASAMHLPFGRLAAYLLVVMAMVFAMVGLLPQSVRADEASGDEGISTYAINDHTVQGLSPNGTTINLFDYWIDSQDAPDNENAPNYQSLGINNGHILKFGTGMGQSEEPYEANRGNVNQWTVSAEPRTGIVKNRLGTDGYPVLSSTLGETSLSYLFSTEPHDGKAIYTNVDGLLQVDNDGYFYYNSQSNFAQFNEGTNGFTLYDKGGVTAAGSSPFGQFFPFNTGDQVFVETGGQLDGHGIKSDNSQINHYFGMTMSTRFVQQYGGHTAESGSNRKEVTYEFSGDDDVWIYIDGVLVGDLGGIHDASSISINFATGSVVINEGKTKTVDANPWEDGAYRDNQGNWKKNVSIEERTTLKTLFGAAGVDTSGWNGDTFADNTYHTLNFFYLERGNTDSNMSLKYNLVYIPESDIVKVDQASAPIAGVEFELYETESDYVVSEDAQPTYFGYTDAQGIMRIANQDDYTVSLSEMKADSDYWVLREKTTPSGYRSIEDVPLYFESKITTHDILLSAEPWDTGAYAQPKLTSTTTQYGIYSVNGNKLDNNGVLSGRMFAVVMQKGANDEWYPITGDALEGWHVSSTSGLAGAVAAAKSGDVDTFVRNSNGLYQVDVTDMPGDIKTYEWIINNNNTGAEAKYTVWYFYTSASQVNQATIENTVRVQTSTEQYLDRQFSMQLYVSNIENRFIIRKVDDTGAAVNGATFALYNRGDITVDQDGNWTTLPDVNPIARVTTGTIELLGGATEQTYKLDGAAVIGKSYNGTELVNGKYYLLETSSPNNAVVNKKAIEIVVDDTGVYANAGTNDDGVLVARGLGRVIGSMQQFTVDDNVDATLHDVKAAIVTSNEYSGDSTNWSDPNWDRTETVGDQFATAMHLQYSDPGENLPGVVFDYAPINAGGLTALTTEVGWSKLIVEQCLDPEHVTGTVSNKTDLEGKDISHLFSGTLVIQVTNVPTGDFELSKTVDPTTVTDSFTFDLEFEQQLPAGATGETTPSTATANYIKTLFPGDYSYAITKTDGSGTVEQGTLTIGELATGETPGGDTPGGDGSDTPVVYVVTEVQSGAAGNSRFVANNETGAYQVKLAHGETLTISDLPVYTKITATEADPENEYVTTVVATPSIEEGRTQLSVEGEQELSGQEPGVSDIENTDAVTNGQPTSEEGAADSPAANGEENLADETAELAVQLDEVADEEGNEGEVPASEDGNNGVARAAGDESPSIRTASTAIKAQTAEDGTTSYNASIAFTNTQAVTLTGQNAIKVQKTLLGHDWDGTEATSFEFTLTAAKNSPIGTPLPSNNEDKVTIDKDTSSEGNAESKTATFGDIVFTKAGTYTYEITETSPAAGSGEPTDPNTPGWHYDRHVATVTVVIDTDNTGKLVVESVEYDNSKATTDSDKAVDEAAAFTNEFKPEPVAIPLQVTKKVTGAPATEEFSFTLAPEKDYGDAVTIAEDADEASTTRLKGAEIIEGTETSETVTFGDITFNAEGTYVFNVTETNQDPAEGSGWTYDNDAPEQITVTVTDDDKDGKLEATTEVVPAEGGEPVDTNNPTFTNSYEAAPGTLTGSASFKGTKTIEGRSALAGESFGFALSRGDVSGKGASWDSVTFQPTNDEEVAFTTASATATMHEGEAGPVEFWFDGTFKFAHEGTYTFKVTETQHNNAALPEKDAEPVDGMTYDRHVGIITVEVTDNGSGTLQTKVTYGEIGEDDAATGAVENDMSFENSYTSEPITWGSGTGELLGGHKYINDTTGNTYELEAGKFAFTMRAQAAGNPMPEGWDGTEDDQGRGLMTVTNGMGNTTDVTVYDFGSITFEHEDMTGAQEVANQPGFFQKTFQYNIFETGNMPAGISKDNTAYTVTFTVTENRNTGTMTVTPSAVKIVDGGDGEGTTGDAVDIAKLDFTNTYNPTSIDSYQNIFKTLDGRNWQAGDTFTFNVSMTATETNEDPWPQGAPLPSVAAEGSTYTISNPVVNDAGNGFDYTVTIAPTSETGNTYRFDTGKITYEREGIYIFTITEAPLEGGSVASDDTEYVVKVTVEDTGGELSSKTEVVEGAATVREGETTLDFTNTYTSTGQVEIAATKTLNGRDLNENEFGFEVKDKAGNVVSQGTNTEAKPDGEASKITFDAISYEVKTLDEQAQDPGKNGVTKTVGANGLATYTIEYTVSEVTSDLAGAGVTPVGNFSFAITVTVADDGDGNLVTSVKYPNNADSLSFVNSYEETNTTGNAVAIKGAKIIESLMDGVEAPALPAGQFTFTIMGERIDKDGNLVEDDNRIPMPEKTEVKNDADGIVDFGTITYTIENVWGDQPATLAVNTILGGDPRDAYFRYTVTETDGAMGGVTNDSNPKTFVVHVHDNGKGTITVETNPAVTGSTPLFSFVNTYSPGPALVSGQFGGTKAIDGRNGLEGETFGFMLSQDEGVAVPDTGDWASVILLDENNQPVMGDDGQPVVFTTLEATATMGTDGNQSGFSFGSLSFAKPGTYTFKVVETSHNGAPLPGEDAEPVNGMTYDRHVATVTVKVTDNGSGTLQASVEPSADKVVFTNDYNATGTLGGSGSVKINATKTLVNGNMGGGEFTFKVLDANGDVVKTGTNDADGTVTFDPISYSTDKLVMDAFGDKPTASYDADANTYTYKYKVEEDTQGLPEGVTANVTSFDIVVRVHDNDDGTLDISVEYPDGSNNGNLAFVNTYSTTEGGSAEISVAGVKTLAKANEALENLPDITGKYTFTLTGVEEGTNNPAPLPGVTSANNDAEGNVTFGAIEYTVENVWGTQEPGIETMALEKRSKTFVYTMTESGEVEGVDNDSNLTRTFTVVVTDNADGTISVTDGEGNSITELRFEFVNTYNPDPAVLEEGTDKALGVRKLVTGAPNGEDFAFTATFNEQASSEQAADQGIAAGKLENVEGVDESGALSTAISEDFSEDETKSADFTTVKFKAPGVYVFDVRETNADPENTAWTYDNDAAKQITVVVTDDATDVLKATVEDNYPLFTNSYQPASITLDGNEALGVQKLVTGADSYEGFTFTAVFDEAKSTGSKENVSSTELKAEVVGTVACDNTVTASFGNVTFSAVGTYVFDVTEDNAHDGVAERAGWSYDDRTAEIRVVVTDEGFGGQLDATTWYVPDGAVDAVDSNYPLFTNFYKAGSITTGDGDLAELKATKKVTGAPATEEFSFTLAPAEDYGDAVTIADGATAASTTGLKGAEIIEGAEASETVTFGDITFNAEGVYVFNVTETNADPAEGSGWTYDNDAAKQITVVVTDPDKDGKLDATTVVDGTDTNNPIFTNSYVPASITTGSDVLGNPQVTKSVVGAPAIEEFQFTLQLTSDNADGVEGLGEGNKIALSTDGLTGEGAGSTDTVDFGQLTFTKVGDYVFTVIEDTMTEVDGWVYDNAPRTITYHVTDEGHDGQLDATVEGNNPTVTNVFTAPIDYSARSEIVISKTLNGRPATDGQFSFTVTPADETSALKLDIPKDGYTLCAPAAGDGEKATVNLFATLLGEGKAPVTFTRDDAGTTFSYTVTENGPAPAGYTYDGSVYTIDIAVTDDPSAGGLTVTTQVSDNAGYTMISTVTNTTDFVQPVEIPFVNSYSASTDADKGGTPAVVSGTKSLAGTAMREFGFVLEGIAGTNTEGYVSTAVNDENGSFSFTPLEYDQDSFTAAAVADDNGNRSETFTYILREVNGGEVKDGIAYDDTQYRVSVTVKDNGDGTMTTSAPSFEKRVVDETGAESWKAAEEAAFNNTYTAEASVALDVKKILSGRDMTATDSYGFVAYAYDRATQTINRTSPVATGSTAAGQTAADGTPVPVTMNPIEYTIEKLNDDTATPWVDVTDEAGQSTGARTKTYNYAIEEVVGSDLNVSYAPEIFYAQVVVTDNGQGNLTVVKTYFTDAAMQQQLTGEDGSSTVPTFVNTYLPDATSFHLTGTKTTTFVNVDPGTEPELRFMYDIYLEGNGSSELVASGWSYANGTVSADIPVTGEGNFTYRIVERYAGTTAGAVTYDDATYYLTLGVVRNADTGIYDFTPAYYRVEDDGTWTQIDAADLTFANTYDGAAGTTVSLGATKVLKGATFEQLGQLNEKFSFSLYEGDEYTGTRLGEGTITGVDANGNGIVTFPNLSYTFYLQDQPVTETPDEGEQVEGDETPEQGDQTETPEQGAESEQPEQGAEGTEGETPEGGQTGTGEGGTGEGGSGQGGATAPSDPNAGQPSGEGEGGAAVPGDPGNSGAGETVTPIEPDQPAADAPAETPSVDETPVVEGTPEAAPEPSAADASGDAGVQAASIADLFVASEAIADDVNAEPFTVDVVDAGAEVAEVAELTDGATEPAASDQASGQAGTSGETAPAAPAEPVIVSDDLGTHVYTIVENVPAGSTQNEDGTWTAPNGVTYDGTKYRVTVEVEASYDASTQKATMTATVTSIARSDSHGNFEDGLATPTDSIVFTNSYTAKQPVQVSFEGTKNLTGRAMAEGEFSFAVLEGETPVATATNDAEGNVSFTFGVTTPGTHTYTVVEADGGKGGVDYDTAPRTVVVEVGVNSDGTLAVESVKLPEGGLVFNNTYTASGSADAVIEGTKVLTGRTMAEGEFRFVVVETVDGVENIVAAGESQTPGEDGVAAIKFTPIAYGAEDLGKTFTYQVRELDLGAGGVTYDTTVFTVQVAVVDNLDGSISTEVTYPDGPVAFENTYGTVEGAKVEVTPVATKTLTGRALENGEFTFTVADADGKAVSTGTNDADGNVNFAPIAFTETGTYEFVISEVNGRQDSITYDDATFGLVVTVSDDGQGGLVAANVEYTDGTPAFANVYEEPEEPEDPGDPGKPGGSDEPEEPEVPQTGDATDAAAVAGIAGAGAVLVAGAGAFALRRRASR